MPGRAATTADRRATSRDGNPRVESMTPARRTICVVDGEPKGVRRVRAHKVPLDLRPLLRETLEAHQARAQEKGVTLAFEAPSALPLVLADRDRIARVVGDLLDNALRHVPEGGHITVWVEDRGREVAVAVADDRPGVPEEELDRLFEPSWEGDPLGLSFARYIVEAHGGHIRAAPTHGGGLTITFTLPSAALASTGPVSAPSAPQRGTPRKF